MDGKKDATADNAEAVEEDGQIEGSDKKPSFSSILQRGTVPAISLDQGDLSVLADVGVTAYNASSLESNFMQQVSWTIMLLVFSVLVTFK